MDRLDEFQAAKKSLRNAIYLDRAFVLGRYHLALRLQKENGREQAALHFRTALELLSGMPARGKTSRRAMASRFGR